MRTNCALDYIFRSLRNSDAAIRELQKALRRQGRSSAAWNLCIIALTAYAMAATRLDGKMTKRIAELEARVDALTAQGGEQ